MFTRFSLVLVKNLIIRYISERRRRKKGLQKEKSLFNKYEEAWGAPFNGRGVRNFFRIIFFLEKTDRLRSDFLYYLSCFSDFLHQFIEFHHYWENGGEYKRINGILSFCALCCLLIWTSRTTHFILFSCFSRLSQCKQYPKWINRNLIFFAAPLFGQTVLSLVSFFVLFE